MTNCYVDIHVLQTVPANCLNRDDTGSPKTMIYGGTLRSRASSQSLKYAMRMGFKDLLSSDMIGFRTKTPAKLITDELLKLSPDLDPQEAGVLAEDALVKAGAKGSGKDVMFFISLAQAQNVASIIADRRAKETGEDPEDEATAADEENALVNALNNNPSVDIVLFGRMAAANPELDYDAACQVAHAFSTHSVTNEYDYFTAVDDLGDSGAGHLGTTVFNSSTMYRYATLNVRELQEQLGAAGTPEIAAAFVKSFIVSMPTGKQNAFANRTLPNLVYVTIRNDQPVNLAGAFEKPVYAGSDGYVGKSIAKLAEFSETLYKDYDTAPAKSWCIGSDNALFGDKVTLSELLSQLKEFIGKTD